ncbi:MAG: hypothetical protein NTV79_06530, partial [Candidatus Aureabacteria bacterium]|nr:hypothetical protein [Candidatus Auribacterota bacterium]
MKQNGLRISAGTRIVLAILAGGLSLTPPAVFGADFTGDGKDDIAIFRPSTGMWVVRNYTRAYFGEGGDIPLAYNLPGSSRAYPTVFRPSEGLFAVQNVTRVYLGEEGDIPIGEGYGPNPGPYDYIVKPGDAADLVSALGSDTFLSVFVPNGTYVITGLITVDHVRHIVGESKRGTIIHFMALDYLLVNEDYCHIENIQFEHEAANPYAGPLVYVNTGVEWTTFENCRF